MRIRVESDPLRKEIFSGSFTKDYSLDKILREVDVDHKYVWTRSGDEIIIKINKIQTLILRCKCGK